ncbi:sugar phosphate isomerase/epimerase family protein [Streptomyces sp. NPDC059785]|uniref:sugar phosphate isomerase/epimerase family protein n=1 Tax=unclassified Streptomyces TaxID=2593676 RepID=UPI003651F2BB
MNGTEEAGRRRPKVGLSTTAAGLTTDLGALTALGPDSIELCRCGHGEWTRAAACIKSSPVPVGLHCPVPYDGRLTEFEVTGPSEQGREQALLLVERTLQTAFDSSAAYVVVHFPTPHPRPRPAPPSPGTERPLTSEVILREGERLAKLQERYGVPMFVENLSYHPDFGSAADYRALFETYPGLRMCLDVGHAHTSIHSTDLYDFVARTGEFVSSVHLYNTRREGAHAGAHDIPHPDRQRGDEWIDLPRLLGTLASVAQPDYLVLEYVSEALNPLSAMEALNWARDLGKELTWG